MKKPPYRIAQIGTFDLENFGDLLFPEVLEQNLRPFLPGAEIVLFSPKGGEMPFSPGVQVEPIAQLEERQKERPFDALVVGGGDLIRMDPYVAQKENYQVENASCDLWIYPAAVSAVYRIPLLWNTPGAPHPFNPLQCQLAQAAIRQTAYLSTRDGRSAQLLKPCLPEGRELPIVPDSVLSISRICPKETLDTLLVPLREKYLLREGYLVVQASSLTREESLQLAEQLREIHRRRPHTQFLFLPINYVHRDRDGMELAFRELKGEVDAAFVEEKLSPHQMMALLANAGCYMGSSMHGAVVSFAYGVRCLALNYLGLTKISGLFRDILALPDNLVDRMEDLADGYQQAAPSDPGRLEELQNKVEEHFRQMAAAIQSGDSPSSPFLRELICTHVDLISQDGDLPRQAIAYLDTGEGFSQERSLEIPLRHKGNRFQGTFQIPAGVSRIRIDPMEGPCVVEGFRLEGENGRLEVLPLNGIPRGERDLFLTADPQYLAQSGQGICTLSGKLYPLCSVSSLSQWPDALAQMEQLRQDATEGRKREEQLQEQCRSAQEEKERLQEQCRHVQEEKEQLQSQCAVSRRRKNSFKASVTVSRKRRNG